MSRARWLLVIALAAVPVQAAAEEREVVLFRPAAGGFALDDPRLADAIRAYTHDVAWGGVRGETARLTVWYEGQRERDGEVSVTLYVLPPGQEASGPVRVGVRGRLDDNLYRALALKVRAALVGDPLLPRVTAPPSGMVPSPTVPVRPSAPPPAVSKPAAPTPPPVAPASSRPLGAAASVPRATPVGLVIEAGPRLVLSDGTALARAGGAFSIAVSIGTLLEVLVGFAVDSPHSVGAGPARSSATVYPIHAGLRFVRRRGRWTLGGGPRAGVAVVTADAEDGLGRRGDATRASGLVGVEGIVRYRFLPSLHAIGQISGEVLLPPWAIRQPAPALTTGYFQAGLLVGLAFTYP